MDGRPITIEIRIERRLKMAKERMTDTERKILPEMIGLFEQLPIEKKYYILGCAQGLASNLQGKVNA